LRDEDRVNLNGEEYPEPDANALPFPSSVCTVQTIRVTRDGSTSDEGQYNWVALFTSCWNSGGDFMDCAAVWSFCCSNKSKR
jgi:hypothetical protein